MVPTAAFTFLCSAGALQPGTRSLKPQHVAQGTAGEVGGSSSMVAEELGAPGLLPRSLAKYLQQAGAGSRLALVEKQPSRKVHVRVSPPCTSAFWAGRLRSCRVEQRSLGGAPVPLGSTMQPPAWHGTACWGHRATCLGWHGSSVAERESISCVSLTPSPFPNSTKADLALRPKQIGLG